jgi:hypothetical protein
MVQNGATPRFYTMERFAMTGDELRERIGRLGKTYVETASRLGLTPGALHHQMRGERRVSKQTELLLEWLERYGWTRVDAAGHQRQRRAA